MRPSFILVSLLIFSLLLTKTQGIRLAKESLTFEKQKHHAEEEEVAILCNDQQKCTGNIKNRKLVSTSISTTKSLSNDVKNKDEAKDVKVKSMTTSSKYLPEDFVDITEMDYSPARKKSPIHN
ncbi:unnamed protein product [Lathyrus oleraceus]|uniref:Uncharacterized protein n=1 Tax=Pisum sativum TaxID=3888 RepID=A0A9D4XC13_PEA|nr:uncharacterized protein LOC127135175 [Pisum sativum]KAI5416050.1 hypothetical protein KIW84_041188 [Pisum sativum]